MPTGLPPKLRTVRTGENVFQPHTAEGPSDGERPRRKRKRQKPSQPASPASWMASLLFPFRVETLLTIGVMTVLYTFLMVPIQAGTRSPLILSPRFVMGMIFIMLLVQGYFWHFLFQVLRTAAYNEPDLPMTADWDPEGILYDLLIAVQCTLVSFVPLIVYVAIQLSTELLANPFVTLMVAIIGVLNLPFLLLTAVTHLPELIGTMVVVSPALPWLVITLFILAVAYLPMALLAGVLHQTVRAAMPWHVIPAIWRVHWAYLATLLLVIGVAGAGAFLQVLARYVPIAGAFLTWFIVFAGHTAVMHRLGAMYYANRSELDWFPDSPRVM
ncbi:MAG: hypothetical protein KF861_09775 [Planctomycetaceae bacterium]|nr:hypothetical protein [Planctomycetaceae bacterium]